MIRDWPKDEARLRDALANDPDRATLQADLGTALLHTVLEALPSEVRRFPGLMDR
jgi:hypothetical protein